MRYLPNVTGHGRNTHPESVRELIQQSLDAEASQVRVMDNPFANPERCARVSGLRVVCDSFDPAMLTWPSRKSDYAFIPLPEAPQGGVNAAKAALEADAVILAPKVLNGVEYSDPSFAQYILRGGLSLRQSMMGDLNSIASLLPIALMLVDNVFTLQCR